MTRTRLRNLVTVLLAMAATGLASCNIVGPAAYLLHGPPKVDAEHEIADVPTVVFIDDRQNVVNPTMFRRLIAEKVSEELMVRKLVSRTISPHDAMGLASRYDSSSEVMPVDAIGRAVGAEQVIYIEMVAFQLAQDAHTPRPIGVCRVRVIDVANRERVYPSPESEQPFRQLEVISREVSPDLYRTRASRAKIGEQLAIDMGERITKLFYRHEHRELGGNLNPR